MGDHCKVLRCVAALARVVRDGGANGGPGGNMGTPTALSPQVQQYTAAHDRRMAHSSHVGGLTEFGLTGDVFCSFHSRIRVVQSEGKH